MLIEELEIETVSGTAIGALHVGYAGGTITVRHPFTGVSATICYGDNWRYRDQARARMACIEMIEYALV